MVKKINEDQISSSGRPVLPAGHPDLFWYLPGYAIVKGELESQSLVRTGSSSGASGAELGNPLPGEPDPNQETQRPIVDIPQLSDISIVSNTKYFDEIGKERAKIVLKVKNSSLYKANVSGVDARIYRPEGA